MAKSADSFIRSVRSMLRPVLRFCLRNSLRIQQLLDLIKEVAIEVAAEDLSRSGQEVSVSRLHIMTGIHRGEVARIFKLRETRVREDHIVYRVISSWLNDRKLCGVDGKPKTIEAEGVESDFYQLVRSVSMDLNPYTVLFEMERIGAVQRTARGIRLTAPMYIPKDLDEGMTLLSDDTEDLLTAVQENLLDSPPVPNLHIKTEYTDVPAVHAETIRRWFLQEGSAFHRKARAFLSKYDRDVNPRLLPGSESVRVGVCSFSIVEKKVDSDKDA